MLDYFLILAYLISSIFSSIILSSISPDRLLQQSIIFVIGFILMLYLGSQESAVYKSFAPISYVLALVLLLLTPLIGETIRGSTRWIMLGSFQLQTAEIAKPLLILGFAYFLNKFPLTTLRNICLNFLLFIIPTFLIFLQPDLGTALVISTIWVVQVFVAGILWFYVALAAVFGFSLIPFLPRLLHDYQLARLTTFINPFNDPLGSGYNIIQSIIAVGSGGFWGKGLGHGTQSHLRFLPERHTDFIFASLAEELGLVGAVFVIILVCVFIFRLLRLATESRSIYSRHILLGSATYFAFQALINIAMNLGLAPITGVTLPLISYGGSSILSTSLILGLSLSMARSDNSATLLEIR